jgi:hypothetical protein
MEELKPLRSLHFSSPRQPDPIHNFPLLRITDASGVEPIGELICRPCSFMAHEGGGEVLRHARALTLSDEPLAGGVEHRAVQLWMETAKASVGLHYPIHGHQRKEATVLG